MILSTKVLLGAAILLASAAAMMGSKSPTLKTERDNAPHEVDGYRVLAVVTDNHPTDVVLWLDPPPPPIASATGASKEPLSDEELATQAPKARHITLVARDPVRQERVARKLALGGRVVAVVRGGMDAVEHALASDPPLPPPSAQPDARADYLRRAALRQYFSEVKGAPPPTLATPVAVPPKDSTPRKKREGC